MRRVVRLLRGTLVVSVVGATISACDSSSEPNSMVVAHDVRVVVPAGTNFTRARRRRHGRPRRSFPWWYWVTRLFEEMVSLSNRRKNVFPFDLV